MSVSGAVILTGSSWSRATMFSASLMMIADSASRHQPQLAIVPSMDDGKGRIRRMEQLDALFGSGAYFGYGSETSSIGLTWMEWRTIRVGLVAAWVLLFTAPPVSATDFCIVQESADGYVALRARPSADGDLLVRAKPGEAVVIQKTAGGDQIVSGTWLRVMHFPDTVVPSTSDPNYKRGKVGWMHKRFVDECG